MGDLAAYFLTQFLDNIDVFLAIMTRILAFFIVLPILSGTSFPNSAKIILSISIAFMLYSFGVVTEITYEPSVFGYLSLIVKEFFVGFTIGFTTYITFNIIYFAGQMIDYQIGFSMVSIFDPVMQIQVPISGNFLFFAMGALLVQLGGLNVFISAMISSYDMIQIGEGVLLGNERLLFYVIGMLADFFVIGMQMAMPIVGSVVIIDIALGILVKTVPQMNVFVVGIPIKLFAGLVILYIIMPKFAEFFDVLFDFAYKAMENVIGGFSS